MTFKTLALVSIFLLTNQTYSLMRMPAPAPATASWAGSAQGMSPALQQPELVFNPFFTPRYCKRNKPGFPLSNALLFGDTKHVIEYYSNWRGDFQLNDYHGAMHDTLQQAAELDEKKGENLIDFLLTKLEPGYIKNPDCLLEAAAKNNYPTLIKYLENKFPGITAWEFFFAIIDNNIQEVSQLLAAGIDPEKGIGNEDKIQWIVHAKNEPRTYTPEPFAHYPLHLALSRGYPEIVLLLLNNKANPLRLNHVKHLPIKTAILAFKPEDSDEVTTKRITCMRYVLEKMPAHTRPIMQEISLLHIQNGLTREKIQRLVNEFRPPEPVLVKMSEEMMVQEVEAMLEKKKGPILGISLICTGICFCCYTYFCNKQKKDLDKEKPPKDLVLDDRKTKLRHRKKHK